MARGREGLVRISEKRMAGIRFRCCIYSYHVMVGLGTIFIAVMVVAALLLWRGKLYDSRWMLWTLMLCVPLPYIANTAGWMTAELDGSPG